MIHFRLCHHIANMLRKGVRFINGKMIKIIFLRISLKDLNFDEDHQELTPISVFGEQRFFARENLSTTG